MRETPPSMFLEKPLPNEQVAEDAILGAVQLDNGLMADVSQKLNPEDFYMPRNQRIYAAMLVLYDSSQKIDPILIEAEMAKEGPTETFGGVRAILALTQGVPIMSDVNDYVKLVKDASDRRKLIRECQNVINQALEPEIPVDDLLERAETSIYEVRSHDQQIQTIDMAEQVGWSIVAAKERAKTGSVIVGIPTGFADLDYKLQGLRPQQQTVIAARPSMGKTALLGRILFHAAAVHKVPVLFFSIEMSKEEIAERIICAEANIDSFILRSGHLSEQQWKDAEWVRAQLTESAGFFIHDNPFTTLRTVRSEVRRINTKLAREGRKPLAVVGLDHIGKMKNDVEKRGESREREVSRNSSGLRDNARHFNYHSIVLSQINRLAEGRSGHKPMMSDLRESGSLEQDADNVKLIYRADYYEENEELHDNIAEVIVAKNRSGPTGPVKLHFTKKSTRFSDLSETFMQPSHNSNPNQDDMIF